MHYASISPTVILLITSYLIRVVGAIKDESVDRIFSAEELSGYIGKDEGLIYLSVLGEVYDVTTGKDFYGEDTGYSFFAGKDGTASYFSGEFTDDGLVQSILEYAPKEIKSMEQWRSFYETHESYFFVGKLEGEFYDSKGEPTTYLQDILAKMKEEEVKEL